MPHTLANGTVVFPSWLNDVMSWLQQKIFWVTQGPCALPFVFTCQAAHLRDAPAISGIVKGKRWGDMAAFRGNSPKPSLIVDLPFKEGPQGVTSASWNERGYFCFLAEPLMGSHVEWLRWVKQNFCQQRAHVPELALRGSPPSAVIPALSGCEFLECSARHPPF